MMETSLEGYHLFGTEMRYGDVCQRWILVFSEKAYVREMKTLKKRIFKEKEQVEKQLWHFSKNVFNCEKDGLQALEDLQKKWRYHKTVDTMVKVKKKLSGGRGRPKREDNLKNMFYIHAGFIQDEKIVQQALMRKGRFIIATNALDKQLSDDGFFVKNEEFNKKIIIYLFHFYFNIYCSYKNNYMCSFYTLPMGEYSHDIK